MIRHRRFLANLHSSVLSALCALLCLGVVLPSQAREQQDWWLAGSVAEGGDIPVKRSPSDDRKYRYLELDNHMRVLLVSDVHTDKAAASLNVNVGSFDNPPNRHGLAHFLEHMLFLGTDRYPEPGAYQLFISEHGGKHNAYTGMEDTNYFFDVDARYLGAALDRFARFFVAPRFHPEYVERERNAVESEYRLKLKDDNRREWEIFGEQVEPSHPLAWFSVGNLETLADRPGKPLRDELIDFYKEKYSSHLMTLAVVGTEPLDQLEAMVRARFAEVPLRQAVPPRKAETTRRQSPGGGVTFTRELPFELRIEPVREIRELSVVFPVDSVADLWRTNPEIYWGHLLGDETDGSLIAHLREQGLADGLAAGLSFDTRHGALFSIKVELTPLGLKAKDSVLADIFAWVEKAQAQGPEKWRFDELAEISRTAFRFSEKLSPPAFVQHLSRALRFYPPEEVLRGSSWFPDYDESVLSDFVAQLEPDRAIVMLVAPELGNLDRVSKWYSASYGVGSLAQKYIAKTPRDTLEKFAFAPPNPYLPEAYPVSEKNAGVANPVKLENALDAVVWHYEDTEFGSPRAAFEARLLLPKIQSCDDAAQTDLYLAMVVDGLSAKTYQAGITGLGYSLYRTPQGVNIGVDGYADRQATLLEHVLSALTRPQWDANRFQRKKQDLIRSWRNSTKSWPVRQLFAQVKPLLTGACDELALADSLDQVDLKDVKAFRKTLFRKGYARFYAGGVLPSEQTLAMAEKTLKQLGLATAGVEPVVETVAKIPQRDLEHSVEVEHADHSVLLYVQGDADTLRERAHMAMIKQIMEAPFYSQLRTEKQLGYAVGTSILHRNRVPGIGLYVQSPQTPPVEIKREILHFLKGYSENVTTMSETDLDRFRNALLAGIEEKPKNLSQRVGLHQEALYLGFDDFAFRDELANQVRAITLISLKDAYHRLMVDGSRRLWLKSLHAPASGAVLGSADLIGETAYRYAF